MKHTVSKLLWQVFLLLFTLPVLSETTIEQIDMRVDLQDNGDALITEVRVMDVGNEGTESYIVVGNLGGSKLKNFSVRDENGKMFEMDEEWDIYRSRSAKTNRCGIVTKDDGGYELCWGLGESGARRYTVSYTITSLLRSYDDVDGFNWMFVARNIKPSPQKVKVTVVFPEVDSLDYIGAIRAWGFGYYGKVDIKGREIVAESDGELTPEGCVIVMASVDKGFLHPTFRMNGSFEKVKKVALEGSNFTQTRPRTFMEKYGEDLLYIIGGLLLVIPLAVIGLWRAWRSKKERREMTKDLEWYRDIPLDGDLQLAYTVYNTYTSGVKSTQLVSAMLLRMLRTKTLLIEEQYIEASKLKKVFGGTGKVRSCIVIGDFDTTEKLLSGKSIRNLYEIFKEAAAGDRILQPNELKSWMEMNAKRVSSFIDSIDKTMSYKEGRKHAVQVRQVLGLKKFLEDFTLANERHLSELGLWKDYLVYAELFGIADQVRKDMMQVNAEYLKMDDVCRTLNDTSVLPLITHATFSGIQSAQRSAASGGGGSSSFGGGGGSFGGGSGGGVR